MYLKFLNPEVTLKLIEGYENSVTPGSEERERFYQEQLCPRCRSSSLVKTWNQETAYAQGDPYHRYLLKCSDCGCLFDPHSGILLTMGNIGKAFAPGIPILEGPED